MKNYQTSTRRAGTSGRTTAKKARRDPGRAAKEAALALPDSVSVSVGELVGELEEGLLAFVVGAESQGRPDDDGARGGDPGRAQGPPRPGPDGAAPRERRRGGHSGRPPGGHPPSPGTHRRRQERGAARHLRLLQLDRATREDGRRADAGQGVHPPLPGRPGAGGRSRRGEKPGDVPLGGLPTVRGHHRDRVGAENIIHGL